MPPFARYIYLAARVKPEPPPVQGETCSKGLTAADKLEYVERWKRSGKTKRDFAESIGVTPFTFRKWVNGQALGQHGSSNKLPQEVRDKALKLYREGTRGRGLAEAMGIPWGTVGNWIREWRQEGLA